MTINWLSRGMFLAAALAFTACPSSNKCNTNADCMSGQTCSVASGTCVAGTGGGLGGGGGGGFVTGGGSGGGGGALGGGMGGGGGGGGGGGMGTDGGTDGGVVVNNGGEICEMAETIQPGTLRASTVGKNNDYVDICGGPNPGPDSIYVITVPAGQRLNVTATPDMDDAGNQYDLALFLVPAPAANCTPTDGGDIACVAGSDAFDPTAVERAQYTNNTASPVDLFIFVDSYFAMAEPSTDGGVDAVNEGSFTLTTTIQMPPAGDVCGTAIPLTIGTPLTNQDLDLYSNDYLGTSFTCSHTSSADVAYSVTVPAGELLLVTVTPNGTFDPALSLVEDSASCGTTCVDSADVGFDGDAETLRYANKTAAPQTLFVVVDGYPATGRTFTIAATSMPLPADDVCEGATPLAANATVSGTTVGYSNDYESVGSTTCSTGYLDADRAYAFTLDAGVRAIVTVTPTDAGFNPSLNFIEGPATACAAMPRVCAAGSNVSGTSAAETLHFYNGGGTTKSFFAIVDSTTSPGPFTIQYTTDVPPADDTCSTNTTALTTGALVNANLTGFKADYLLGAGCPSSNGPDRVYRAQLASDEKLSLVVTPTGVDGGFDPVVKFVAGPASACDSTPRACAGGINLAARNQPETAAFTNNTGAASTVYVLVADGQATAGNRDFSLAPTIAAAAAGESCRVPTTLTAGMLVGQTLAGASADVTYAAGSMGCEASNGRPDRVYSATVQNGQTITVAVTPAAALNLAVNLVDGPAAACTNVTSCLDSADMVGAVTTAETVSWTNTSGAAKTIFVQVVSSPDTTSASAITAAFSLNTTIQ